MAEYLYSNREYFKSMSQLEGWPSFRGSQFKGNMAYNGKNRVIIQLVARALGYVNVLAELAKTIPGT